MTTSDEVLQLRADRDRLAAGGTPGPVAFKLVPFATHVHTECRLYAGPDRDHLALCGELRLRHHEYSALQDALTPPRPPVAAATTLEMRALDVAANLTAALHHLSELPADVRTTIDRLDTLLAEVNRRTQAAGWPAEGTRLLNAAVNRRAGGPTVDLHYNAEADHG